MKSPALASLAIGALLAPAVVIAAVWADTAKAQSEDGAQPVRIISASYKVDFPVEVKLELEAEADSDITDLKLFYRISGSGVKVYGYPEFVRGRHATAEFAIPTSGSSHIPSGVEIRYHYVIGDAEGNSLESPVYGLTYRDPGYDWREDRVGALRVQTHGISEARVIEVTTDVNARLEDVMRVFGLDRVEPKTAVILNSRREADRSFPPVSEAARRGHLYAGFAFRDFGLFALVGLDRDGMIHEMSHLLLADAVDNPLARIPAWLNEGLAMYFETGSARRRAEVERAARDGALFHLRNMSLVPGRPDDVRLFYAQSWSVVDFIFDVYGPERMTGLLRKIDEGARIDDAILGVYGITIDQLESAWSAEVAAETPLATRPDLLTIGSSLLIAIAVLFTATVAALRWTVRRAGLPHRDEDLSID